MRWEEMAERLARQAALGGIELLDRAGGSRPVSERDLGIHWHPSPEPDGRLQQDPDFRLPTLAGPMDWSLYHDSQSGAQTGPYGYGRRGSFPLNLVSDGAIVTVMHEDGSFREYGYGAPPGQCPPRGDNFDGLQQNGDGSWDETRWETGTVYHYPAGSVVSVAYRETPQGLRLTYNYDSDGRLESTLEPGGRRVTLGYAAAGLTTVQYVQDWGDRRTTLSYDAAGNLAGEQDPSGALTTYAYDAQHRITRITDPEGFVATYSYDADGRVASRCLDGDYSQYSYAADAGAVVTTTYEDPLGRIWTHSSDAYGKPLTSIDPLGNRETLQYANHRLTQRADPLGNVTSYLYDGNGFLLGRCDPLGNRLTLTRDGYGNLLSETDPLGAVTTYGYASPQLRQAVSIQDPLGRITTLSYLATGAPQSLQDPLGQLVTFQWTGMAQLEAMVTPLGARSTRLYDAVGNKTADVDPLGYRTSYGYDAMGRRVTRRLPLGKVWTTQYDARGLVRAEIQAHYGFRTTHLYNAEGDRTVLVNPYGDVSSWIYDAAGRLEAEQDAYGYLTTRLYDPAGREIGRQDARGYLTTSAYDAAGRRTAETDATGAVTTFGYDAAGRRITTQDGLGYVWTTVYDAVGRETAAVDPLGNRATHVYDTAGQEIAHVDALGRTVTSSYDEAGRFIGREEPGGYRTTTVWDADGRPVCAVDANGARWTSAYDTRSMLRGHQDPLGALTTFQYDGNRNRSLRIDARGARSTYSYEPRDLPLYTTYPDGGWVTVNYDQGPRQVGAWDGAGRRLMTYDRLGRLVELRNVAVGWRLTHGYDPSGNRSYLLGPDLLTTYQYDGEDRCTDVLNPSGERTTFAYDALGRESVKTHANGMTARHTYDPAGREVLLETRDAAGLGLAVFTAAYDGAGNRTAVQELDGTPLTTAYDARDQLVNEQRGGATPYNTTYQYDGAGNRLVKNDGGGVTTYSYNVASELTSIAPPAGQPATLAWDANGNLLRTNDGGALTTYTWDYEDRLGALAAPDGSAYRFFYNTGAMRARLEAGGSTVHYVWDDANLLLELDGSRAILARYTDLPGSWGGLASELRGGVSSFYGFDLQGSTRLLVSAAGAVTDRYAFRAFGELLSSSGATVNPFRYVGRLGYYMDAPSRYYVRARYLDPAAARWLSRDPIDEPPGRYLYVSNNPLTLFDPSGLVQQTCPYKKVAECMQDCEVNYHIPRLKCMTICAVIMIAGPQWCTALMKKCGTLSTHTLRTECMTLWEVLCQSDP